MRDTILINADTVPSFSLIVFTNFSSIFTDRPLETVLILWVSFELYHLSMLHGCSLAVCNWKSLVKQVESSLVVVKLNVYDARGNASFTSNQSSIPCCWHQCASSHSGKFVFIFLSKLHSVTCTHTHTFDQRFMLSECGDLWTNGKWNKWQAFDLPDCHLRTDNTKDNPYVQAAHDTLSHCLRAFLNCKLNIYYPNRHMLHSFPMEHMHRSSPMMNAMVWHEPVQFQIW